MTYVNRFRHIPQHEAPALLSKFILPELDLW